MKYIQCRFFSNFNASLNTVDRDFLTVKLWHWNFIYSAEITVGIFLVHYNINIIDDRDKYFPGIRKMWQTNV